MKEIVLMKSDNAIKKCLHLANKAEGKVSPNPLVGAVVFDKNGEYVSCGYHERCGEAHAEVNALKKAGTKAQGGTIAVNLEPCSHWGKTPPCVDLIIKSGIKKVIVGMLDPNPKVNGNGVKKLKEHGIEVEVGILQNECERLNEIFIKNQKTKKPFIAIKTATTLDGKIATSTNDSKWTTSEKSRKIVHQLRNRYDAILTSSATVIADNPQMTCRLKNGRNPIRVILDKTLKTDFECEIYKNNTEKIFVVVDEKLKNLPQPPKNVEYLKSPLKDGKLDLQFVVNELFAKGIMSILIEAGGKLNGAFLKENLVDKIYHFQAPKILGDSKAKNWVEGFTTEKISDSKKLEITKVKFINPDFLIEGNLS